MLSSFNNDLSSLCVSHLDRHGEVIVCVGAAVLSFNSRYSKLTGLDSSPRMRSFSAERDMDRLESGTLGIYAFRPGRPIGTRRAPFSPFGGVALSDISLRRVLDSYGWSHADGSAGPLFEAELAGEET